MPNRYSRETLIAAARSSSRGDLVERITALEADPVLDEASMRVGEALAATLLERIADASRIALERAAAGATADEIEVDVRPVQQHIADAALKAVSAAYLRGVLLGHTLASGASVAES